MKFLVFGAFLLAFLLSFALSKEKVKSPGKSFQISSGWRFLWVLKRKEERKPILVEDGFYCSGCEYLVKHTLSKLRDRKSEADVPIISLSSLIGIQNKAEFLLCFDEMSRHWLSFEASRLLTNEIVVCVPFVDSKVQV